MADMQSTGTTAGASTVKRRRRTHFGPYVIQCRGCGGFAHRDGPAQKRCKPCSREFNLAKKRAEQASRTGGSYIANGAIKPCAECGGGFASKCARQKYCDGCRDAARRQVRLKCCKRSHQKNREERRASSKAHYEANKAEILAYRATEEYRAYRREINRRRYAKNPRYRLNRRMSGGIARYLQNGKQSRSWASMVPYSLDELATHLERQFVPGMSWGNYGEWEIDHILPLSSFSFSGPEDADFQGAWALTNLRPLWRPQNRAKHARRTLLI